MRHGDTPPIRTRSKDTHVQTHSVVLEREHEEHAVQQERPDEHVRNDPCRQAVRAHHCSPTPEQRDEIPSQWSRNDGYVDQVRSGWVAEVNRGQVEEIEHKHELSDPEVAPNPEEEKGRLEYIVDDEMASDVGSGGDPFGVVGKQMPDVADLKNKKRNPTWPRLAASTSILYRYCSLTHQ